jgi:hypothetical protein
MAGDVQLTALQTHAAPLDYIVPGSALIRVKSIRGEFTDNGAAGAWLPAVQLISDSGHVIATASDQGASVAAGGSADASFFPGVKASAAASSSGGTLAGYGQNSAGFTWGPGNRSPNFDPLITNDASVFSNRPGFPNQILIQHGGLIRCDVAIEFATTLGGPYAGTFQAIVSLFDSTNNPVNELTGPPIYYAELYATSGADNFRLSGTTTFNADDTFYAPPYHAFVTFTNAVNSVATSAALLVSIENPAGLV